jgi:hypothetical protein
MAAPDHFSTCEKCSETAYALYCSLKVPESTDRRDSMHGSTMPQEDEGIGAAAPERACFLCDPAADLVFFEHGDFFALAGLGPVVEGYALFGTRAHIKSMADVPCTMRRERDTSIGWLRDQLSRKFGRCLVTEHGRMAVCADDVTTRLTAFTRTFYYFPEPEMFPRRRGAISQELRPLQRLSLQWRTRPCATNTH